MHWLDAAEALAPGERTLPALLQRQAATHGDRPLLRIADKTWTCAELRDIAARRAGALAASGIAGGDRVAILCSNRFEFVDVLLGCAWLGAIAVPINVASRGAQLQHVLAISGAGTLVIEEPLRETALEHVDRHALPLQRIWTIGGGGDGGLPGPGDPLPPAELRPGHTIAILFTSGTTGPSKGVCCPHAQFFWWGIHTGRVLGVRTGDVLCTTLPIFHTNALNTFFQALLSGATLALEPRFSASAFWSTLIARKATVTYVLGAMVPILLSRPPTPEERQHTVRVALAPGVPAQFHPSWRERTGIALVDGYGSTETNLVLSDLIPEQRPGSMGRIWPGFDARVVDDDDNEVPLGVAGELIVRADAPYAFATGYFGMEGKTVEAWRNLWFHTGDRVIREADGYFRFVDRMKDAIRRRGENISSFEVEQVLLSHAAVATVAVFPVRSELAEDEVMAAIVCRDGFSVTPLELTQFCEPRLPYFAVPRFIEFLDTLPTTESGKIQKYKLSERGVTAATWDREAAGYRLRRP